MNYTAKLATKEDLPTLSSHIQKLLREEGKFVPEAYDFEVGSVRALCVRSIADEGSYMIKNQDGISVGSFEIGANLFDLGFIHFHNLFVPEAYRGQGAGSFAVNQFVEIGTMGGYEKGITFVNPRYPSDVDFFVKRGFGKNSLAQKYLSDNGAFLDSYERVF